MYYFSKSTCGFYESETHGKNMPSDAVEITAEARAELLSGLKEGVRIEGDENGYPVLKTVSKTTDELSAQARVKRALLLAACDWTALADAPLDESARAAWTSYRQSLRDITSQPGFPVDIEWPEVHK